MSDLNKEKERANLRRDKEAHRRARFLRSFFEGKLTRKQYPLVQGYSHQE